jgi:hypothetical protein
LLAIVKHGGTVYEAAKQNASIAAIQAKADAPLQAFLAGVVVAANAAN